VNKIKKELEEKEKTLKAAKSVDLLPRKKRRVYSTPKHDVDLTNYRI